MQNAEENRFEDVAEGDVFPGKGEVGVLALCGLEPGEAEELGGEVVGGEGGAETGVDGGEEVVVGDEGTDDVEDDMLFGGVHCMRGMGVGC